MKIILKPVGLICVVVAFATLTWLAIRQNGSTRDSDISRVSTATGTGKAGKVGDAAPMIGAELTNGGFEEKYVPVQPFSQEGVVSGTVAAPWVDDSSWAPITVEYSREGDNPYEGRACQKVMVSAVSTEKEARVQFSQEVNLTPNKRYRASCWVRADRTTQIDFALRQKPWPYRYYGVNKVTVGREWKKIEVSGTPNAEGTTFVMLKISKPVTFWVDDAEITP